MAGQSMLDRAATLLEGTAALETCRISGFVCLCLCDAAGLGRGGSAPRRVCISHAPYVLA